MKQELELYIHIPFCVKKCLYCDFLSFSGCPAEQQQEYITALLQEMDCYLEDAKDYCVTSVFLGGGTPSSLREGMIATIFSHIYEVWDVAPQAEITIECNPGTLNREKLEEYLACGINRISFGLQSANNEELKRIGRIHNYEQFVANYKLAREAGFHNINVDIMSALPGQDLTSYGKTLAKVLSLQPEHISAYSLIVEEGTPLSGSKELLDMLPTEQQERNMYRYTKKILTGMGYEQYEISNYAKTGYECIHNLGYWTGISYLGLGLGAASYYEAKRFHNTCDMERYMQCLSGTAIFASKPTDGENTSCDVGKQNAKYRTGRLREEVVTVSKKNQMEEFMFLGLRLMRGVSKELFYNQFGYTMDEVYGDVIKKHVEQGLLTQEGQSVLLTAKGIDVSNYVLADFLLEDEFEDN